MWFSKKERAQKVDVLSDIQAIEECLGDTPADIQQLLPELKKLEELEKEREVVHKEHLLLVNLETQAEVLDKLLQKYQFFQDDVDINGLRLKKIAAEFLKQVERAGLKDLVKKKRKELWWKEGW